jgi:tRNA-specific 2-thiouridylase
VAAQIGIPHYVFDHSDLFRQQIVEPFLDGWAGGRTPSPCIDCNRSVKFGLLWDIARSLGAGQLATGHYARLEHRDGRPQIRKARDLDKDQTYFLSQVRADALRDVLFPLGEVDKQTVRDRAREFGLAVADKPESYELCFIPDGDKDRFVGDRRSPRPGDVRHIDGRALGRHTGTHQFTVGQRRGLGVSAPEPLYVIGVQSEDGTVIVGSRGDLGVRRLRAEGCNWLAIAPPTEPMRTAARIRHRHPEAAATIIPAGPDGCAVEFDEPQDGVAPGQGIAFYEGDLLLGGGWIASEPARMS